MEKNIDSQLEGILAKARETILEQVKQENNSLRDEVEKLKSEYRKDGEDVSSSTQAKVKELEDRLAEERKNWQEVTAEMNEKIRAEMENIVSKSDFIGMNHKFESKGLPSLGAQIVSDERFKTTFDSPSAVEQWSGNVMKFHTKAAVPEFQDYNDLVRFYEPWNNHPWRPDGTLRPKPGSTAVFEERMLSFLQEPLFFEDLIPVRQLPDNTRTIEYIKEVSRDPRMVSTITSASSTAAAIELENANGFYAGQAVEVEVTTGAFLDAVIASVNYATSTITLTGVLATATKANGKVRSHTFGFHQPTETKPEFEIFNPELESAYISDLAIRHTMTRQILRDVPGLMQELNVAVLDGMRRNRERQLMYGPGNERSLQGLLTHPDRQTMNLATLRTETGNANLTILDALHYAITQTELSYLPANVIIMHPYDWQKVALLKDSNLNYLVAPRNDGIFNAPNVQASWGLPVVTSQSINRDSVFVGNLSQAVQMYRAGGIDVSIFDQHADYAARNMLMLRAEESVGVSHRRPQALLELTLNLD